MKVEKIIIDGEEWEIARIGWPCKGEYHLDSHFNVVECVEMGAYDKVPIIRRPKWYPKVNDLPWTLKRNMGGLCFPVQWHARVTDVTETVRSRVDTGRLFPTEEAAQEAADKVNDLLKQMAEER